MITLFVSATAVFLGFLFLRDSKEKHVNPSWIKICFYFIILIVVGVFFYKTNQVMTVYSNITIENYRSYFNKNDSTQIADSIDMILIDNSFLSNSTNNAIRYTVEESKSSNISLTIKAPKSSNCVILDAAPRSEINSKAQFLKVNPEEIGRMYQVTYASSCLIPFVPILLSNDTIHKPFPKENIISIRYENTHFYDKEGMVGAISEDGVEGNLPDFVKPTGLIKYYSKSGRLSAASNRYNVRSDLKFNETIEGSVFDFFTAADISQYILSLKIYSPCHIGYIEVKYDMPIEVQSDDRGILSGTLSFIIYGNILNNVKDHQSSFYVKLPTMANLQTVRSFILTTLIAALLALLISSLGDKINYYKIEGERFLLSKFSKNGVKNSTVTQLKEWKQFQMVRNTLLLILTCFICYISYRSFIDEPFVMSAEEYSSLVTRLVLFTLLALAILSFMYYRYLKKK